jgi:hypothetical protein
MMNLLRQEMTNATTQRGRTARWCASAVAVLSLSAAPSLVGEQPPIQSKTATAIEVIFEVQTSSTESGGATEDQITILFCNTSGEATRTALRPFFGEDIVAEFSFSGRDARPGSTLIFRRFVSSTTFMNARFIRVVNHGHDGWAGSTLSLTVDGKRILDRQSLYPRKGASTKAGIEKYNPLRWSERVYWEGDFQRLRLGRASVQ